MHFWSGKVNACKLCKVHVLKLMSFSYADSSQASDYTTSHSAIVLPLPPQPRLMTVHVQEEQVPSVAERSSVIREFLQELRGMSPGRNGINHDKVLFLLMVISARAISSIL